MSETLIDNGMRRALANLTIPRTVTGLELRLDADPYAPEVSVSALLEEAESNGWIVNIGSGSPKDITASVRDTKEAVGFGKGATTIWRTRAEAGRYHTNGDHYMLTKEGLGVLRGPQEAPDEYVGTQEVIDHLDVELGNDRDGAEEDE